VNIRIAGAAFLVGIVFVTVFVTAFSKAVDYTNTTEFCVSCHSQQIPFAEYKESPHYENASGVRAGCPDCHVPRATGPKLLAKVMAVKDVYHELLGTIDTPEKFEERRWAMANRVWRKMEATDSRECRACHVDHAMNLREQDSTARKKHRRAMEEGKTCINCHTGIAHTEPHEPI
jgi:nitrate/TMAO reductase-like tetraheme cytochrome c subunit